MENINLFDAKMLFEINRNAKVEVIADKIFGKAVIIDDFYENPEDVRDFALSSKAQLTTFFPQNGNGRAYIDARVEMYNAQTFSPTPNCDLVGSIFENEFKIGTDRLAMSNRVAFNLFQSRDDIDPKYQLYPHTDESVAASVIYLDHTNSGGTCIYKGSPLSAGIYGDLVDDYNGLVDIDKYYPERVVIPSKFNRCVVYQGIFTHGQYVSDYSLVKDKIRVTQVMFSYDKKMS